MFVYAVSLIALSLLVALVCHRWIQTETTIAEYATHAVLNIVVISGLIFASYLSAITGHKLIHGSVISKNVEQRSCSQYWSDSPDWWCTENLTRTVKSGRSCSTDSKGRRSCHDTYKTQYYSEFPWERKYWVHSDLNQTFQIARIDRQGARLPPRHEQVKIGDPVTVSVAYTNYIQADPDSILNKTKKIELSHKYPTVYDYYNADLAVGTFSREVQETLRRVNQQTRTANVVLVDADGFNIGEFPDSLQSKWKGFNINDIVIIVSRDLNGKVEWSQVRSWSKTSSVEVELRDLMQKVSNEADMLLTLEQIPNIVNVKFTEANPEDFKYMVANMTPPRWALVMAFFVIIAGGIGIPIFMESNDPFNTSKRTHSRRVYYK